MDTLRKEILKIKDKVLNLDILTKRSLYKCKENYLTLSSIPTWTEYVVANNLKPTLSEEEDEKLFRVDEQLNSKVSLWQGDITRLEIDGIVNAANSRLLGGGGVDGCIHDAAGPDLLKECETLEGCEEGSAKITGGYELPAKYVIHAVGPTGEKPTILKAAYEASLQLMLENQLKSIAFPCISTGIFGYPTHQAAHVALLAVRKFLQENQNDVDRIIFTTFSDADRSIYEEHMHSYFPVAPAAAAKSTT